MFLRFPSSYLQVLRLQFAGRFCNAIGILQQCSSPASFSIKQQLMNQPANSTEEYAELLSALIAGAAKDIDILIDSMFSESLHLLSRLLASVC